MERLSLTGASAQGRFFAHPPHNANACNLCRRSQAHPRLNNAQLDVATEPDRALPEAASPSVVRDMLLLLRKPRSMRADTTSTPSRAWDVRPGRQARVRSHHAGANAYDRQRPYRRKPPPAHHRPAHVDRDIHRQISRATVLSRTSSLAKMRAAPNRHPLPHLLRLQVIHLTKSSTSPSRPPLQPAPPSFYVAHLQGASSLMTTAGLSLLAHTSPAGEQENTRLGARI